MQHFTPRTYQKTRANVPHGREISHYQTVFRSALQRILTLGCVACLILATETNAQNIWNEGFEQPATSWRVDSKDVRFRVQFHQRVRGEAYSGEGCERIQISAKTGTFIFFKHNVGQPTISESLIPRLQVKSDRPGLQLAARVVLPRILDPTTGKPRRIVVDGTRYTTIGHWQQLCLADIPARIARKVRRIKSRKSPNIDIHGAYIEHLILNVYGGPGLTNVWIDELEMVGHVPSGHVSSGDVPSGDVSSGHVPSGDAPSGDVPHRPVTDKRRSAVRVSDWTRPVVPTDAPSFGESTRRSKLEGSVLQVDGRPFFVRAIAYRGESLPLLKRLGFNAIWLERPPSSQLLDEVRSLGLWIVCPPPFANRSDNQASLSQKRGTGTSHLSVVDEFHAPLPGASPPFLTKASSDSPPLIDASYDHVLAWDLGTHLTQADLPAVKDQAQQLRRADRKSNRPVICHPEQDLRAFSRYCDLLVLGRAPLGTTLELTDYGKWIRQSPRLARPGTPIWTTVQTQPDPSVAIQWEKMGIGPSVPTTVSCEQTRLAVYTAVTSDSRGLLFESHTRLDATDPDTLHRAMTLELLNLELLLIEPWLASGSFETTASGSQPETMVGAILRTERSRLLVPIFSASGSQIAPGPSAANGLYFDVPGVPETHNAYRLSTNGLQSLRHKRVTGGTRVVLDEFSLTSLVVFSQDPMILTRFSGRFKPFASRAAALKRALAIGMFHSVKKVDCELKRAYARTGILEGTTSKSSEQIDAARQSLQQCDGLLTTRDYSAASLHAERAMRSLRRVKRDHWRLAVKSLPSTVTSPACVDFRTLPWHWNLIDQIATSKYGPNRLPSGDFEDLGQMLQSGWNHYRNEQGVETMRSGADLIGQAAQSGQLGLRLFAHLESDEESAGRNLLDSPPAWMTTPPIPVVNGQIILIHGWVQIPSPIIGSVDGLVILDSIGGLALADRIGETTGWQEFLLYRIAPESTDITIRFALTGLGEAWLDNVSIHVFEPTAKRRTLTQFDTIPSTGFVPP